MVLHSKEFYLSTTNKGGAMVKNEIGPVLNLEESAKRLSLSVWTLRKMVSERRVDYVKIGRRIGIPVSELERILQKGLRKAK